MPHALVERAMTEPVPLTPLEPWIAEKIGRAGLPLARADLHAYQLAKLNEMLALAQRRSAHYRRSLGTDGICLSALQQLAELPFTTAEDLKAAPYDFLCASQDEVERIVTLPTSGTTGPPKRILFSAQDQELTRDFFHHGMSTMVEAGDRVLILLPGSLPGSVGELLKEGLERRGVIGIPHGPVTDPARTLRIMDSEAVTALVGVPVQVLLLSRWVSERALGGTVPLRCVLLSTDRVPYVAARAIEAAWGCEVFNHYGATEMGLGGGVDCRARQGYHLREADLLFEIVDPATGKPVPEGESGEVVFTTLTREAMPLVRYRTGDVSHFVSVPCPCGSTLRRMAHVDDRLDAGVTLPDGTVLRQRDFDEALFSLRGMADFKVLYGYAAEKLSLHLYVRPWDQRSGLDETEVLRSLETIPALSGQLATGGVSLKIARWDEVEPVAGSMAKRKLEPLEGTYER
jgi:phenylacetate-CoA ligase